VRRVAAATVGDETRFKSSELAAAAAGPVVGAHQRDRFVDDLAFRVGRIRA